MSVDEAKAIMGNKDHPLQQEMGRGDKGKSTPTLARPAQQLAESKNQLRASKLVLALAAVRGPLFWESTVKARRGGPAHQWLTGKRAC